MSPTWTVEGRGILPNTPTDTTAPINATIRDLADHGGGVLGFGPGVWRTRGVILRAGVILEGAGQLATTLTGRAGNVVTAAASPDGVAANAQFSGVRAMTLHGQRGHRPAGDPGGAGFYSVPNPLHEAAHDDPDFDMRHTLEDVLIRDVPGAGVHLDGRGETRLRNVQVFAATGVGIRVNTDAYLSDCSTGQTGGPGFYATEAGSIRATGCKAFYAGRLIDQAGGPALPMTGQPGWHLAGCQGVALVACEAQDCGGDGFFLEQTHRSSLVACIADSNTVTGAGAGVHLYGCRSMTVRGTSWQRAADGRDDSQAHALWIEEDGDPVSDITLTHSAGMGARVGPALHPGSGPIVSSVRINGAQYGPVDR